MRIDTWIPDVSPNGHAEGTSSLVTIDTDDVWLETFAHWDQLVPSDVAADIATATVRCLIASQEIQP